MKTTVLVAITIYFDHPGIRHQEDSVVVMVAARTPGVPIPAVQLSSGSVTSSSSQTLHLLHVLGLGVSQEPEPERPSTINQLDSLNSAFFDSVGHWPPYSSHVCSDCLP